MSVMEDSDSPPVIELGERVPVITTTLDAFETLYGPVDGSELPLKP